MDYSTFNYVENFYVGSQEYVILWGNGTHHVKPVANYDGEHVEIEFSGHYEDCKKFLDELHCSYYESLF